MKHPMLSGALAPLLILTLLSTTALTTAHAYEVTDKFSISGMLTAAYQCQNTRGETAADDLCRGAMPIQPEMSFRPHPADEFFFKWGFAAGNGLNEQSPFIAPTWAADAEADVIAINGRQRDNLLNAWYKHTVHFEDHGTLGATFGIVDAADYLDSNAYANDEYAQFMNAFLTNAPNVFLPSYDMGAVLEWKRHQWQLNAVVMNIGENDDGNSYTFYGAQAGVTVDTPWGEGHYRIMVDTTNDRFVDTSGTRLERRTALILNCDQALSNHFGAFLRIGWQEDKAAIDYEAIYSGGIDIKGSAWGRAGDNIGLGYAWIDGGNLDIERSHVAEAYYRLAANDQFAVTGDIQYIRDSLRSGPDQKGLILGLRMTAEF